MNKVTAPGAVPASLIAVAVLITSVAPLATDMYVPAFPAVARDLTASTTAVQLTLTTFFVGMALGQLLGGPISDQRGRRVPLVLGTVGVTVASIVCALAPSIGVLAVARLLQGFAGGWAMVVVRAVLVDLARGSRLVRVLNLIGGVGGIALIAGPLLGGVIVQFSVWRTSFWLVAAAGLAMTVCVLLFVPDSLPAAQRHGGGLRTFVGSSAAVLRNRRYVGYVVVASAMMIVVFAYVSSSAFILEDVNGLGPIQYSVDFAANAAAASVAALLAARLAGRVPTRRVIGVGQVARRRRRRGAARRRRRPPRRAAPGDRRLPRADARPRPQHRERRGARIGGGPGAPGHRAPRCSGCSSGWRPASAPRSRACSDRTSRSPPAQLALAGLVVSLAGFLVLARPTTPSRSAATRSELQRQ